MKNIVPLLAMLLTITTQASIFNNWLGSGHVELNYATGTSHIDCPEVELELLKKENEVRIHKFDMLCYSPTGGRIELDYGNIKFKAKGNNLLYRNEFVGSYTNKKFYVEVPYLGEETLFTLSIKDNQDKTITIEMSEDFSLDKALFNYHFTLQKK